jgi:hypothetical protein
MHSELRDTGVEIDVDKLRGPRSQYAGGHMRLDMWEQREI